MSVRFHNEESLFGLSWFKVEHIFVKWLKTSIDLNSKSFINGETELWDNEYWETSSSELYWDIPY